MTQKAFTAALQLMFSLTKLMNQSNNVYCWYISKVYCYLAYFGGTLE